MKHEVATCFNSFNINLFYTNLVWPLFRRQNDNLAPKLGKVAHAWSRKWADRWRQDCQPYAPAAL
jgi:hypothetical protein